MSDGRRRRHLAPATAALFGAVLLAASGARAALPGLPAYEPINPIAAARSGLAFEPYRDPAPGLTVQLALDYGSLIEAPIADTGYRLDAEVVRLSLELGRDLSKRHFVLARLHLGSAHQGWLDGLLDTYHRAFAVSFPERDERPANQFLYRVTLPDGTVIDCRRAPFYLGDLRLGIARRHGHSIQSLLTITLPMATAPDGYQRGAPSFNLVNTWRQPLAGRLFSESSLGLGHTPRRGDLQAIAGNRFLSLSSGLRLGLFGRQALYANLWYHSPYYHGSGAPALDRSDVALDAGWIGGLAGGGEWRLGLVEDLRVSGPAVDLVFRLGLRF